MKKWGLIIALMVLNIHWDGLASVAKKLPIKKLNEIISEGAFRGGQAGNGFSLLDIKRVVSTSLKNERMIFEIGTLNGTKYSGQPGYFQAQLRKRPPELSIDFAQTVLAKFDQNRLLSLFKTSKLVKNTIMTTDAIDNSTNITLILKKPIKARVYTLAPKDTSPKVVVDLLSR